MPIYLAGAGLAVGDAVSGGGTNRILYEDGSQLLAASSRLTFDGSTLTLLTAGGQTGFSAAGSSITIGTNGGAQSVTIEPANSGSICRFTGSGGVNEYRFDKAVVSFAGNSSVGGFQASNVAFTINSTAASNTVEAIVAAASQSANLTEWRSSGGTVYGTVSENGYHTTRKTSAPADAELAAGEAGFWFDATNGAGKLMVKAKTADGTVVTGSITLA